MTLIKDSWKNLQLSSRECNSPTEYLETWGKSYRLTILLCDADKKYQKYTQYKYTAEYNR